MATKFWSKVGVAVQSALATAVTITGITKANPGVVSWSSGTDPANGDYVLLQVQGMVQLNNRIVRVANLNGAGNTFELEGVDTTNFDTFTSGTFQVITFGNTLTKATGINVSGGDAQFADITTIHDSVQQQVPTVASALNFSFECLWDPADAALAALKVASDNLSPRAVRLTFADGGKFLFYGYVSAPLAPTGTAQQAVKTPVDISVQGVGTAYAT